MESILEKTLGLGGFGSSPEVVNGESGEEHVPIVFTSDYRRDLAGQASKARSQADAYTSLAAASREAYTSSVSLDTLAATQAQAERDLQSALTYKNKAAELGKRGVAVMLSLNPKSISFDQPKRFSRHDTKTGATFHHFTNSLYENNDVLKLTFQGSTGSIVIFSDMSPEEREPAQERLRQWHDLYQLTREQMYFQKDNVLVRNRFHIVYASPLIPVPFTFTGFYENVLKFSETADKPRSRSYDMSFIVEEVSPPMSDLRTLVAEYNGKGWTRNLADFEATEALT